MLVNLLKRLRRAGAPHLAAVLALVALACTDAPTAIAPQVASEPLLQVSGGWPGDLLIGCPLTLGYLCGFDAAIETQLYADSLIRFDRSYLSSVLTHPGEYYRTYSSEIGWHIDLNTPMPSVPIAISFSPAVSAVIIRALPQQNNCDRWKCTNYYDGEGREPRGSWEVVAHEANGEETRIAIPWECITYPGFSTRCGSGATFHSDVGLTRVEIIPSGTTLRDHLGFQFTAGRYRDADSLALVCPDSVVRGQSARCAVAASSGGTAPEVLEWHFQPADTSLGLDITPPEVLAQDTVWEGMMATSGTVRVKAKLADSVMEATRFIAVTPRPGWDTTGVVFPKPIVKDSSDMSDHPYRDPGTESLGQLGHIHEDAATWFIGSHVQPIGSGPNSGLAFLTAIPYIPKWVIHINLDQLKPTSNLGMLQLERSPDYESERSCTRSQLPGFVRLIKEHEGADLEEKSHAGRFSKAFNEQAGSTSERIVLTAQDFEQGRELDRVIAAFKPVIAHAKAESSKADTDFKVRFGCTINLFPAPTSN